MTCDACNADLTYVDHRLVLHSEQVADDPTSPPLLTVALNFCNVACLDAWGAGRLLDLLAQQALCENDPTHGFRSKVINGLPLCAACVKELEDGLADRLRDLALRVGDRERIHPDEISALADELQHLDV